jgi:hypothetical protein
VEANVHGENDNAINTINKNNNKSIIPRFPPSMAENDWHKGDKKNFV